MCRVRLLSRVAIDARYPVPYRSSSHQRLDTSRGAARAPASGRTRTLLHPQLIEVTPAWPEKLPPDRTRAPPRLAP